MTSVLIGTFAILALTLWIWAVLDLIRTSFKQRKYIFFWIVILHVVPVLGPIFYFQYKERYIADKR